jgi:fructokinase
VGEILEDLLAEQRERRLDRVTSWTAYLGGAPANVACALARLGTPAASIGCVGRDRVGEKAIAALKALGVDTAGIQHHPTAPTRRVHVTRSTDGERHFAGFGAIPTTDFADTRLSAAKIPVSLFENARFLVTGTLGFAYPLSREALERSLALARSRGVKIFLDVNWRPVFWPDPDGAGAIVLDAVRRADLVKCSDEEARWLFGTDDPARISRELATSRAILVTAGERGCRYRIGENEGYVAAFPVETVDTTGAGDGFSAGFLHRCLHFGDPVFDSATAAREAVVFASAVGAIVTTGEGAIAPQPSERQVAEFLRDRSV